MEGACSAFVKDYKKDDTARNVTGFFDKVSLEPTIEPINIGIIVGGAVGGVLCIVAAALFVICCRRRKKRSQPGHNVTPVDDHAADEGYMHRVSNPIRREIDATHIPMAEETGKATTTIVTEDGKHTRLVRTPTRTPTRVYLHFLFVRLCNDDCDDTPSRFDLWTATHTHKLMFPPTSPTTNPCI